MVKKWYFGIWDNVDYAKWNGSGAERQVMYIVSNTWNPPPQKKLISLMAVETKTVVTRAGRRQVRGKAYQWVVSYD